LFKTNNHVRGRIFFDHEFNGIFAHLFSQLNHSAVLDVDITQKCPVFTNSENQLRFRERYVEGVAM